MFYLLKVIDTTKLKYDYYDSKVIEAGSELMARKVANFHTGTYDDEGYIWENSSKVSCVELCDSYDGPSVVIASYNGS